MVGHGRSLMCIEIKTTYLAYSEFAICAVLDISKLTATDMFQIKGIALQAVYSSVQCSSGDCQTTEATKGQTEAVCCGS